MPPANSDNIVGILTVCLLVYDQGELPINESFFDAAQDDFEVEFEEHMREERRRNVIDKRRHIAFMVLMVLFIIVLVSLGAWAVAYPDAKVTIP